MAQAAEAHSDRIRAAGENGAKVLRAALELIQLHGWAAGNVSALDSLGRDTRNPISPACVSFGCGGAIIRARNELGLDWRAGCAAQITLEWCASKQWGPIAFAKINGQPGLTMQDVEALFLRAIWRAENTETWPSEFLEGYAP